MTTKTNKKVSLNPRDYPNFGLLYSLETLHNAFPGIHGCTPKIQARFADAVCRALVSSKHPDDIERVRVTIEEQLSLPGVYTNKWSTTIVGNLAYMSLHTKKKKHREKAKLILDEFNKMRYEKQHVNIMLSITLLVCCCVAIYFLQ